MLFTKKIECLIHLNNTIVILPSIAPIHQYLVSQQSVILFFFCLPSLVNMFSNNTWAGFMSLCLYVTFSQSLFSHRHCKMCSCSDHLPSPIIFHLSLSFARLPTTANDTLQRSSVTAMTSCLHYNKYTYFPPSILPHFMPSLFLPSYLHSVLFPIKCREADRIPDILCGTFRVPLNSKGKLWSVSKWATAQIHKLQESHQLTLL